MPRQNTNPYQPGLGLARIASATHVSQRILLDCHRQLTLPVKK